MKDTYTHPHRVLDGNGSIMCGIAPSDVETQYLCRVLDLDISDLRIREIGTAISPDHFPSLTDLKIAQNSLTSLHGLLALPRLTALNADGNRLGSCNPPLFSKDPANQTAANLPGLGDVSPFPAAANSNGEQGTSADAVDKGNAVVQQEQVKAGDAAEDAMEDVVLPALQVLQLGDNRLTSIEMLGVARLTNLRSLFLQNNQITKVDGLSALGFLEELVRISLQHLTANHAAQQVAVTSHPNAPQLEKRVSFEIGFSAL